MEGGYKCLHFLCCAYWPLSLDSDNWSVGCGCLSNSGVLLRTESGNVSPLVALETESALDLLLFFFVRKCGTGPCASNIHGVWVVVIECIPPLELGCPPSPVVPFCYDLGHAHLTSYSSDSLHYTCRTPMTHSDSDS